MNEEKVREAIRFAKQQDDLCKPILQEPTTWRQFVTILEEAIAPEIPEELTQDYLKSILDYNRHNGLFAWKLGMAARIKIGAIAGTVNNNGYLRIKIKGKKYMAHRLAWFYQYGQWPEQIDHINRMKLDNRLSNLRDVSDAENQRNRSMQHNNTSGVAGVCWRDANQKWWAYIGVDGKKKHLGFFTEFEDAVTARRFAEDELGYHPNHGREI